jgi:nucleoside-diphosphate-sugar epimerase
MTMLQFAEEIVATTKSKSKIVFRPLPQDDPKQRRPDITKAKKILGWSPRVSLRDGLANTIGYFSKKV